jgi:tetratricopeptide (TPR) repeat protein
MRIVGAALGLAVCAGCFANPQPPLDEAAMAETVWPACITKYMQDRMAACPVPDPPPAAAQAACVLQPDAPWHVSEITVATPPPGVAEAGFARLAQGDAKAAAKLFRRAGKAGSAEHAWASYGLAHAERSLGNASAALEPARDALKGAIARKDEALRAAAQPLYVATYAEAGDIAGAYDTFKAVAGEPRALAMLDDLAARCVALGHTSDAMRALEVLAAHDPARACEHEARAVDLARARGTRDEAAYALSRLMDDVQRPNNPYAAQPMCRRATARALASVGEHWRNTGLAEGDAAMDHVALDYAAQAQGLLLDRYAQDEIDELRLCINLAQVAHERAVILYTLSNWQACGPAFEEALAADPRGQRGEQAALAAVTCRQRAWLDGTATLAKADMRGRMLATIGRADDWRMMLRAFHRYMCVAEDRALDVSEPYAEVALDRGQAFQDGGALWEAAIAFRTVAFGPGDESNQLDGAQRYALLMENLAADDNCRIDLGSDLEDLIAKHCKGSAPSPACDDLRGVLARVRIR